MDQTNHKIKSIEEEIANLKTREFTLINQYESTSGDLQINLIKLATTIREEIVQLQKQIVQLNEGKPEAPSPMMIDLPVSADEELTIGKMKKYVYTVDGTIACATAITANLLASCYHCIEHYVITGPNVDEIQSHRDAIIYLSHAVSDRKIRAKILAYSIEKDVVLLQSDEKLMADGDLEFRYAFFGQPYFLLGTPISDDGNPLQVISGRISAKLGGSLSTVGHSLHGHGSARPGASGGPVFSRQLLAGKPSLLGIAAAGQTISHETKLHTFISSNYVKIISIATLHDAYLKCIILDELCLKL